MKYQIQEGLRPYLPENSIPVVMRWLNGHALILRVSRGRKTKLGDYRPPIKDRLHRISVNQDLNPYEFLLTLTHEIAHMLTWDKYSRRMKPHGKAWKAQYSMLIAELMNENIFPPELKSLVTAHLYHPRANSSSHENLARGLHAYNPGLPGMLLEDLDENKTFTLPDGRRFIKQQKLRKWYRCLNLEDKKLYRISPVARVMPVVE